MKSRDLMKGHYNILMNLLFTPTKEFPELLRTFSSKEHKGRLFNLKKLLDAMFIRGWCFLFFLSECQTTNTDTGWKFSVFGVILVVFSHIWTENGEILRMSPYSVQMREITDQNNSEYEHFLGSVRALLIWSYTFIRGYTARVNWIT